MDLLLALSVCLASLIAIMLYAVHRVLAPSVPVKGKTNIPGPTEGITLPVLGDSLWFIKVQNMIDFLNVVDHLASMTNEVMSFRLGSKLIIAVMDANMLQRVINTKKCQIKDDDIYHPFKIISDGVFSRNGKKWFDLRRPLENQLRPTFMGQFIEVFAEKATTLSNKVGRTQGTFDINEFVQCCTVEITLETLLGINDIQPEDSSTLVNATTKMLETAFKFIVKPYLKVDWIFNRSTEGRTMSEAKTDIKPILEKMIENRYQNYEQHGLNPEDPNFEPDNYIDTALQVGKRYKMDKKELTYSFFDLMIAGYDTSAIAMSSSILFLAMHPDYQEKVYQEQLEIMGDRIEAPTQKEMSQMTYLTMVLNETLRHVSVPIVGRTATARFEIDGYIFPEGASIMIFLHHMHRSPKYWENPNEFYPDHFLPESVAKRDKGSFLPFGIGSRVCPGRQFALISMKLIISMLIRRYKFTTKLKFHEMVYKFMIMVESNQGYPVEATRRDGTKISSENDI